MSVYPLNYANQQKDGEIPDFAAVDFDILPVITFISIMPATFPIQQIKAMTVALIRLGVQYKVHS